MAGQSSDDIFKQVVDNFAQRTRDYASGIASRLGSPFDATQLSNDQAVQFWNFSPKYGSPQAADQAYHQNVAQGMPPGQALDDAYPMRKMMYQQGTDLSDHIDAAQKLRDLSAKTNGTDVVEHPPTSTLVTMHALQPAPMPQNAAGPAPGLPSPVAGGAAPGPATAPGAAPAALPPQPPGPPAMGPVPNAPMGMPVPVRAMQEGGIVDQPTLTLLGEAGPEAVVPLNGQSNGMSDQDHAALQQMIDARDVYLRQLNQPNQDLSMRGKEADSNTPATNGSPWTGLISRYAGEFANDPRFVQIVAAAARAESSDDPRAYQLGYNPNDPSTWQKFGGRGLWQFDIGPQGMGHGVPEHLLFNPEYQAAQIVPQFAAAYRQLQNTPGLDDQTLAALVYGATERPAGTYGGRWQGTQYPAYQNYLRAWNTLQGAA